ncbi:MAG: hypothetical protein LIP01_15525 [Tannerellaceae bacterium]|nr:hypothetical protein [Tannerellaceae bacterium]
MKAAAGASLSSSGTLELTFEEDGLIDESADYKMLLCINMGDYMGFSDIDDLRDMFMGSTESQALKTVLKVSGVTPGSQEQEDNSNSIKKTNLPMSVSLQKKADESEIFVELVPAVVGLDVISEVEGYELVSASVWNAMTTTPILGNSSNSYNAARTERFYGVTAKGSNEITGSLYTFENYVSNPKQDDKETTCLIVGLRNENTGDIEYFRVNVTGAGNRLDRNYIYTTTLKSVSDTGAATEREAYENAVNFVYELSVTPRYLEEISYLGGSSEEIHIDSNAEWVAEIIDNNTDAVIDGSKVFTGSGKESIVLDFAPLKEAGVTSYVILRVTIADTDISEDIRIDQKSILSTVALTVLTNTNGVSTLASTKDAHYYKYVYQLGQNMRNTNLFGMEGTVYMPGEYAFKQAGFTAQNVADANFIRQFLSLLMQKWLP